MPTPEKLDGIHDIHMNQGNPAGGKGGGFSGDNGVWQDGALFINLPSKGTWTAVFYRVPDGELEYGLGWESGLEDHVLPDGPHCAWCGRSHASLELRVVLPLVGAD